MKVQAKAGLIHAAGLLWMSEGRCNPVFTMRKRCFQNGKGGPESKMRVHKYFDGFHLVLKVILVREMIYL